MKQLFNFLLLFLLCSCASDKARESTQADDDTVKTAVTYFDKEFFNIKGPVKTLSLSISGSEYGKQEVAFDRNGKIVSWYIDGNPVVFERDSNQRIVKYTKQYFASYDEIYEIEPRVITQTTTYFYDDEGRVSKKEDMWDTAVGKDSEKYLTYNDEGAPTKVERHTSGEGAGSYNYTYTYSDNDSHGNWLKVKKAGPYDTEINKRVITYYTDSDNDSFAEKKQKEFEQAIANQSSDLNKKVAANMKEYKQVLAEREEEEYYEVSEETEGYNANSQYTNPSESGSQIPRIYSADSFINAVSSAKIYNSEGGRLEMSHNGLWIGGTTVSNFAPRVISFNSVGGVLQYQTLDSSTITFMVDFSEKLVIGKVSGGTQNIFFTIR